MVAGWLRVCVGSGDGGWLRRDSGRVAARARWRMEAKLKRRVSPLGGLARSRRQIAKVEYAIQFRFSILSNPLRFRGGEVSVASELAVPNHGAQCDGAAAKPQILDRSALPALVFKGNPSLLLLGELLPDVLDVTVRLRDEPAAVERDDLVLVVQKHERRDAWDVKLVLELVLEVAARERQRRERDFGAVLVEWRLLAVRRHEHELKVRVRLHHVLVRRAEQGREGAAGGAPLRREVQPDDLLAGERRGRRLLPVLR
ncbi:hypothetical protein PybrP1_010281 [[Pythium] brassicae (nom. inval.)]|nr:hypothetical protein PybrP1_010281 [[Pythium] brassicae (nom. inval.)]